MLLIKLNCLIEICLGMLGQAASAYQASQEAYASSGDLAAAAAAAAGGGYSVRRWAWVDHDLDWLKYIFIAQMRFIFIQEDGPHSVNRHARYMVII